VRVVYARSMESNAGSMAIAALVAAVGEASDTISVGWPALLVAGLFVVGLAWLRRGGLGGVIFLGVFILVEVVFFPSYDRTTTADWIVQVFFLALGIVGATAAGTELWTTAGARR
jgi:cytochrome c biogenesis protein CcdA